MAINKKLIHFNKRKTFDSELANNNILPTSIVFIKDSQEIWTHNEFYSTPLNVEEIEAIIADSPTIADLISKITAETTARNAAITTVTTKINDEVNRAIDKENELSAAITKEVKDRQTAITTEVNDRNAAITVEKNRAIAAEATLQSNIGVNTDSINAEVTRATSAENALDAKITNHTGITDSALALKADKSSVYTKEQVDQKVSGSYKVKGSKSFATLPTSGNTVGDVYNITNAFTLNGNSYPAGTNVVYTEDGWDALAGIFDTIALEESIQDVADDLSKEVVRAKEKETSLETSIGNTNVALNAEVSRAKKAEQLNTSDITTLAGRVTTNETKLNIIQGNENTTGSINSALKAAKNYTDTTASALRGELTSKIEGLDATVSGSSDNITVSVTETDGKLIDVTVNQFDITTNTKLHDSMYVMYIEEWNNTKTPYEKGAIVRFNQEFFVALQETSLPPVDLVLLEDGVIAKVDEHTYATKGSYDADGNKEDWKKIPYDELRLSSRYGMLNGEEVDVRTLATAEEMYQLEPNLYIDMVKGVIKGKKVDFPNLPKKNVTDALGYLPVSVAQHQELTSEMAYVLSTIEQNFEGLYYGVEFDTTISSPSCTRIGDMNMHRTLPIHNKMRGCLLDDNGNVVKYLDPNDWTGEVRDGSQGQVMVELPAHYRKFETEGTKRRVKISLISLPGYHLVPKQYVSAYEASLQRSTNKLSSVVNTDADYRGGNNTSSWDGTYRTLLGRPVTNVSRTDFRAYARNRKNGSAEWNCMTYDVQKELYWLFVVEYATLNSQAAYNAAKDANGYMQGGLGDGVTTWDTTLWNNFNGYYPFVPCGHTDSLGNKSGTVAYNVLNSDGGVLKTFNVPRYRGVENQFGHIWQLTDGINVRISPTSANGGDDLSKVFVCSDSAKFTDSNYDGYSHVGNEARSNGYVNKVIFGEYGEIMPESVSGGSTTYHCDYLYTDIPTLETLRAVMFGGAAHNNTDAGFVSTTATNVPSGTGESYGSRLCFIPSK